MICLASNLLVVECQLSTAPGVLCQLRPRGCVPGEPWGEGPGDAGQEGSQLMLGYHGVGLASGMERWHGALGVLGWCESQLLLPC